MRDDSDTHTESYRLEQGKQARPDPRERQADVPLAPSSAGVLGHVEPETTTVDEDREAAEKRRGA